MSGDINGVFVGGRLTADPELRATREGTPVLGFRVACNERRKNRQGEWVDEPSYFNVVVWGQRGEGLSRILRKGMQVCVQGKLRWREWAAQDGSKRQAVEVFADEVQLPPSGGGAQAAPAYRPQAAPAYKPQAAPDAAAVSRAATEAVARQLPEYGAQLADEDIPF